MAYYLLTPLLASGSPFIHVQKEATFIPAAPVADITQSTLVQDKVLYYHIGDIEYFTPYQNPSHTLFAYTNALQWSPSFEPIAVLSIPFGPSEGVITDQHIRPLVQSYLEQDDVLASKWFKTVYLRLTMDDDAKASFEEQRVPLDTSVLTYMNEELGMSKLIFDQGLYLNCHGLDSTCSSPGFSLVYLPSALKTNEQIIAGPYLAHRRDGDKEIDLFPVSRLYSDTYHTFVMGVYPLNDGKGTYKPLDRVDDRGRRLIAVPSKLYALESNKSLAGVRTAIKDIYDIRGLRTTAGSRAYGAWKGIADETAPSIEILQEGGAVIVGKTKLAQWVMWKT
ncbi:hypothetical protein I316_01359 [Kwoniella heveanensis BCC8398]|uniref:Uncharacterized protein n=1 Tax=Kwoniella heveanensis BCC8398 TaxID=1296120 RepID=A0A1B9H0F5_9TREE|nr:hypothetical protein I316_01359 [Kwoniella heveanensis BCC8398]